MKHVILLTGASGMLGSRVAKRLCEEGHTVLGVDHVPSMLEHPNYVHFLCDLRRPDEVEALFAAHRIRRVIHLAALAHVTGETDFSWSRYFRMNVLMSHHVFECAAKKRIPVFFASTVDVYGTCRDVITENTPAAPVGNYARSKYLAEQRLHQLLDRVPHMIARFAPIYTEEDHHDIRKRYYLKYPSLAFVVGKGISYRFLHVDRAAQVISLWAKCDRAPSGIVNVFDEGSFDSAEMVALDKKEGLARHVLHLPRWVGALGLRAAEFLPEMLRFNVCKVLAPMRFDDGGLNAFLYGRRQTGDAEERFPA